MKILKSGFKVTKIYLLTIMMASIHKFGKKIYTNINQDF
jgi:hypothetical protein